MSKGYEQVIKNKEIQRPKKYETQFHLTSN